MPNKRVMKGAPSVVALAAFAAALSGCGSGVSVPEHGLHSPSRQYSVRQVEAVFAAEGIPLRSVAPSVDAGSIAFLDGRPATGSTSTS
jgi:hypothetical protein